MSRCDFEKRTVGVAGDDIMFHILVELGFVELSLSFQTWMNK